MIQKFTKHPTEQGETYFQHMASAWRVIYLLKKLELKCLVHSVFPFFYKDAVSSNIECLQKMVNRNSEEPEEELYEVYGGD
jgi:hypothetical protein